MPLPTGTVTFLFSDIQGSTQLLQKLGGEYARVLAEHQTLLHDIFTENDGVVVDTQGDSFFVAFPGARNALNAAVEAQRALFRHEWGGGIRVNVRMGLHTGEPTLVGERYVGIDVHRAARIGSTAHGGQVLISETTQVLARNDLPVGLSLRDLGEHRLKDLRTSKHLYQLVIADLPSEFPALCTLDATPNNLPVQLTSFVGREKEIRKLKDLIPKTRLLTLTGAGGSGKTRLSLQVAGEVLEQFRDGVWFIELAPLAEPELVPQIIASVLGVREQTGEPIRRTLVNYLRGKNLLLVLDNCEHLIEACAKLADDLLHACPQVKILASSREALGITGEVPYRVPSLSLPDARRATAENLSQYEAVRLFIDRAVTLQPAFAVSNQNAPAVAQICARLDGIPLALELAAARIKVLKAEQIAERLDDRFRLLTGGSRTALPRQQTLRAAIDWSYDLLSEQERILLRRLSVFAGGWSLKAGEFVCTDDVLPEFEILESLAYLVDKSLVVAQEELGEARYQMLETVRQYAHEKLLESGEAERLRERELEFYVKFAEEAEQKLKSAEERNWYARLDLEFDNLRSALEWAHEHQLIEPGLRAAGALDRFWLFRGHYYEGRRLLEVLLAAAQNLRHTPAFAKALAAAGNLAEVQGDFLVGHPLIEESLQLFRTLGDPVGTSDVLMSLVPEAMTRGDHARARLLLEESLSLSRAAGYKYGTASAYAFLGHVIFDQGDHRESRAYLQKAIAMFHELGIKSPLAITLSTLGEIAFEEGDYVTAHSTFEEGLAIAQELENKMAISTAWLNMGRLALVQSEYNQARLHFEKSAALCKEMGYEEGLSMFHNAMGRTAMHQGDYQESRNFLEKSLKWCRQVGNKEGIAWELQSMGHLGLHEGNVEQARDILRQSLTLFGELETRVGICHCLEDLAQVAELQGHALRAVLLSGAAASMRETIGVPLAPYLRHEYDMTLAGARDRLDTETFVRAWAEGRNQTMEQAIVLAKQE